MRVLFDRRSLRRGALAALTLAMVATTASYRAAPDAAAAPGDSPITGSFFVDLDRDGMIDAGEELADTDSLYPPGGIAVTATDDAGVSVAGVVSAGSPPTWSVDLDALDGSDVRLEFSLTAADEAAGWSPTELGPDSGSSVQFAGAGDDVTFGVVPPSQCPSAGNGADGNANAAVGKIWTTCFVNGDRSDAGGPQDVLVALNHDFSGSVEKISDKPTLGSVWGLGYDQWDSLLFASAYVKRHVELGDADGDTDNDTAGLYWFPYPSEVPFSVDLESLGGPTFGDFAGSRDADTTAWDLDSDDIEAFEAVGQIGIGDIDVSPDGRTLFVVNLASKALMAYDISEAQAGTIRYAGSYTITDGDVTCPDVSGSASASDWRPFGLAVLDAATVYVGVTCNGLTSQDSADLEAVLVELDLAPSTEAGVAAGVVAPNAAAGVVHRIGLDYARGALQGECNLADGTYQPWLRNTGANWVDNADGVFRAFTNRIVDEVCHPTPTLSDINVEADGDLVVTFLDRTGDQLAYYNNDLDTTTTELFSVRVGGETLHVCNVGSLDSPSYVTEGGPGCATTNFPNTGGLPSTSGLSNYGPAGAVEWFGDDQFDDPRVANTTSGHAETTMGGAWIHPFRDDVMTAQFDPVEDLDNDPSTPFDDADFPLVIDSGGLATFDLDSGVKTQAIQLYRSREDGSGTLFDPTPGTFGKANGLGDIEGCAVPLEIGDYLWLDLDRDGVQDPGEVPLEGITLTITGPGLSAAGVTTTTDSTGRYVFGSADGLLPNSAYSIAVDPSTLTTTLPGGFTHVDLTETVTGAGTATTDSNLSGGVIAATTSDPGVNDHTFDGGYTVPKTFDLALVKTVNPGTVTPVAEGDRVTFDVTVTNQGDAVQRIEIVDYVDTTMFAAFATAANPARTVTSSAGTDLDAEFAVAGDDGQITLQVTDPADVFAGGDVVTVPVTLTIATGFVGPSAVNWAEIASFDDDLDSLNPAPSDVDSTPDRDIDNDAQPTGDGAPGDDEVGGDGSDPDPVSGDEDDHDVAAVPVTTPVYDLALRKVVAAGTGIVSGGDDVTFEITVFNQSAAVKRFSVVDYVDVSMFGAFDTAANPDVTVTSADGVAFDVDYSAAGANGSISVAVQDPATWFARGDEVTVEVNLTVADPPPAVELVNWAEISSFDEDFDDSDTAPIDVDSAPDATQSNDSAPAGPGSPTDDVRDNSAGDEDDHDVAGLTTTTHSIGNQVWFDADDNGRIDAGESSLAGVALALYAADGSGEPSGSALATTTTDASGRYLFDGLTPGTYVVVVAASNFGSGGPLESMMSSTPTEADPNTDIDGDDNGFDHGLGVISGPIVLSAGEPRGEDPDNDPATPDEQENLTVDFGFWLDGGSTTGTGGDDDPPLAITGTDVSGWVTLALMLVLAGLFVVFVLARLREDELQTV